MKAVLYLGLEVPDKMKGGRAVHFPIIRIVPRPREELGICQVFAELEVFTHIFFTSKSAVDIFFDYAKSMGDISQKCLVAVGKSTAERISLYGPAATYVAMAETAEGMIEIMEQKIDSSAYVLWPKSALARPVLGEWMQEKGIRFRDCILYDTVAHIPGPLPKLDQFDEIVFTSPSTVDAFLKIFGSLPKDIELTCIGPVTQKHLVSAFSCCTKMHSKVGNLAQPE